MGATIHDLLALTVERGASDLHITSGTHPQIRLYAELVPLTEFEILSPEDARRLIYGILNETQQQKFEAENQLDFSFSIEGLARFRANTFLHSDGVAAAIRVIPFRVPSFEELGLPRIVEELADRPSGLVLVTGPTGSGKTTTLSAMIDKVNRERAAHIVTIEDPIEFVHAHRRCVVHQREVYSHVPSFEDALRTIFRQNPDVILVGEMRDLETIQATLTLAETGHLTFATLHTTSCARTINRIIDIFPPYQQPQVRSQLSLALDGVLSQALIPRADGRGLVLALEIMVMTPAIRNLIREQQTHQIYSAMQAGTKYGMQTMNQALAGLARQGLITPEQAMASSSLPEELTQILAAPRSGGKTAAATV